MKHNNGQESAERRDSGIQEANKMTDRYIYYINDKDSKAFKIGISSNPQARLDALQTASPHKLVLTKVISNATSKMEREHQARFESSRIRGEWFRTYDFGDELLVEGKAGNLTCLILDKDGSGNILWRKKWNIRASEMDKYSAIDVAKL